MVGRRAKRLTVARVKSLKDVGMYSDGDGLYLQVSKHGTKSWIYRYSFMGKRPEIGLGSVKDVSLSAARDKVRDYRKKLNDGIDPKSHKRMVENDSRNENYWTFEKCANAYIEAHSASWKNEKHIKQWYSTLNTYAYPFIGNIPVKDIDIAMIMNVLEPIWIEKTETATRVRGRVERILAWAIVNNYRDHPNPALWRSNLDQLLPAPNAISPVNHHSAMPYGDLPSFFDSLLKIDTVVSYALQFTILTACRTSEVIKAEWDEIKIDDSLWVIPKERMKSPREHRVPLSPQAVDVLQSLEVQSNWVFPSNRVDKHIGDTSMLVFLKSASNRSDLTVHGFRSSFRDWCAEKTSFPRELAEAALAHVVKDKTEAAYQRGDMLEKRMELMIGWAEYLYS